MSIHILTNFFFHAVSRHIELIQLRRLFWSTTYLTLFVHLTPFLVTLLSFAFYAQFISPLTAATVFTSITLFNTLKQSLQLIPNLTVELVGLGVAVSRVEKYLNETEMQKENISLSLSSTIGLTGVNASWNNIVNLRDHNNDFGLRDITVEFPMGKISLICTEIFKLLFFSFTSIASR